MDYLKSKDFWECAGNRAIRTFAQTMVSLIPASAILTEINWKYILSASVLAAGLSILTSISTGLPEVEEEMEEGE